MAEASVVYRAIADFTTLRKEVRALKRDLRELKAEELAFNAAQSGNVDQSPMFQKTARAAKAAGDAINVNTRIIKQHSVATDSDVRSLRQHALAAVAQAKALTGTREALVQHTREIQRATAAELTHTVTTGNAVQVYREVGKGLSELENGYVKLVSSRRVAEDSARSLARVEQKSASDVVRATEDVVRARRNLPATISRVLPSGGGGAGGSGGGVADPDPGGRGASSASRLGNVFSDLGGRMMKIISIAVLVASALGPLIAILGAVGSAALAVVGAVGQASGALLTLPAAGAVAALSIGTLVLALRGVVKAFQAYSQQQKTSVADAKAAAKAQQLAARQVADATRALARTRQDAARAAKDAAQRVADAERGLASAQKGVLRAQLDLNQARKDALRDLENLRAEVARGGLDEESAVAALAKAQQEYNNVEADANATSADRLDALSRLHQAEQDLADVRTKRARDSQDLAAAEKKGVEGSDKVTAAKDNQANAEQNLSDSQRALKRAQEDQARSAIDWAQRISDAQRNLADAHTAVHDAQVKSSASANAFNTALKNLSPNAQKFVLGLIAMKDQFKAIKTAVQDAFFGPLLGQLGNIRGALKPIKDNLVEVAGALGTVAAQFIEWLTSPEMRPFFKTLADETAKIILIMGPALIDIFKAFTDIITAGLPYVEDFAKAIAGMAGSFKDWASDGDHLNSVIGTGVTTLGQFWTILGNLAGAFGSLMKAAAPFIDWIMGGLVTATQNFQDFADAQKVDGSPFKKYLENIKPLLKEVGGLLHDIMDYIFGQAADPKNIKMAVDLIHKLRTDLGPAIARLIDVMRNKQIMDKFIDAVTKIAGALTKLIDKTDGLSAFFTVIGGMADAFGWIVDNVPGAALAIEALTGALGGLLALKFTGLLKFLTFLGKKGAFDGLKLGAKGLLVGGAGGEAAGAGGLLGLAKGGLKGGGLAGLAGGIAGSVVGDKINDHRGGAREVGGRSLKGAATGAGLGASIGAVAGVGVFSWLTAPIGAAIGAILGVIVANWKPIKEFFTKTAFPALVKAFKATWDAIISGAQFFWDWLKSIPGLILAGAKKLPGLLFDAGKALIQGLWDGAVFVFKLMKYWFENLPRTIVGLLVGLITLLVNVGKDIIQGLWNGGKATFKLLGDWIRAIPGMLVSGIGKTADLLLTLAEAGKNLVRGLWNGAIFIFDKLVSWIRDAPKNILGGLGKSKDLLGTLNDAGRSIIQGLWDGMKAVWKDIKAWLPTIAKDLANGFTAPIRYLIETVVNKWILGSLREVPFLKDHVPGDITLPKFARGGQVDGTGTGDTVPAMLTPGEVVIKKSSVDSIGAGNLLHMNATGRMPGYASGGMVQYFDSGGSVLGKIKSGVGKVASGIGSGIGKLKDAAGNVIDWGKELARGGAAKAFELLMKPVLAAANHFPQWMGVPEGPAKFSVDQAVSFIKGSADKAAAAGGIGTTNPDLEGALRFAKNQIGKPYVWGAAGPSGYDCSGFMSALELFIQGNRDPFQHIIGTGSFAGGPAPHWRSGGGGAFNIGVLQAGQKGHDVGHMAGTLNGVNVESRGGQGVLVGSQARGANDPLFTSQFALAGYAKGGKVMRSRMGDLPFDLLDPEGKNFGRDRRGATGMNGGGLIGMNGGGLVPTHVPLSGYSGGVTSVSNATTNSTQSRGGMTVEQMVINNPMPERASDSIPRSIRKMSYLNSAGTN